MEYRVELYDHRGVRLAAFDSVPLLEAARSMPGGQDRIQGMLPRDAPPAKPGCQLRVFVAGELFCEAEVVEGLPEWGPQRKLILDQYVRFETVRGVTARQDANRAAGSAHGSYRHANVSAIVKDLINRAPGRVHYTVAHGAYPEGAEREHSKFLARKTAANALAAEAFEPGNWAGPERIDGSGAWARDGRTVAGLVVDGTPWPDVGLLMVGAESLELDAHAIARRPETAAWTSAQYALSGYALKAQEARDQLQALLDEFGVEFLELNPFLDESGNYAGRFDGQGRAMALVFGGGRCLNAAMTELGAADVDLHGAADGVPLPPDLGLKEFLSYTGPTEDSIGPASAVLSAYEAGGSLSGALTALAYMEQGWGWTIDSASRIAFKALERPDLMAYFDPAVMGAAYGQTRSGMANRITLRGNPLAGPLEQVHGRPESEAHYGREAVALTAPGVAHEAVLERLATGLLDDLAYPAPAGYARWFDGKADVQPGALLFLRDTPGGPTATLPAGTWGDRFAGERAARVSEVVHRFMGRQVSTEARLTSPLRSVLNPLDEIRRSHEPAAWLRQFRLDHPMIGLDMGYHLDG